MRKACGASPPRARWTRAYATTGRRGFSKRSPCYGGQGLAHTLQTERKSPTFPASRYAQTCLRLVKCRASHWLLVYIGDEGSTCLDPARNSDLGATMLTRRRAMIGA